MVYKVLTISIFFLIVQCAQSKDFPKDIPRCHPSDNACVVKVTNEIIKKHPHGYAELNLVDLEPFRIDDISLNGDPSKPVNFNLQMTNLSFVGFSKMMFEKMSGFKKDPKDIVFDCEAVLKNTELKGKYKVSGKMLLLPITGDGDISIKMNGLRIKSHGKTKVEVKDGEEYIVIDTLKLKTKADGMTIKLTNLFNGDKTLSENMVNILNDNWKVLWDEIEPTFSEQLTKVNKNAINNVFSNFPYKNLFLKDGEK